MLKLSCEIVWYIIINFSLNFFLLLNIFIVFLVSFQIRVDYYWPDVSKELKGGTLIIKHIKETTYAEYTVRQLKIHNQTVYKIKT